MDRVLRIATPVVLVALGLCVWFETWLLGTDRGLTRFVLGLVCIYTALLVLERQRLEVAFKDLLGALRRLRDGGGGDTGGRSGPTPAEQREACRILVQAVRQGGKTAAVAADNLRRITGQDHGEDADAWQRWLEQQR